MTSIKIVNFMHPSKRVLGIVTRCVAANEEYKYTHKKLMEQGYYMPQDQFEAFSKVFNIQVELEVGKRHKERYEVTRDMK